MCARVITKGLLGLEDINIGSGTFSRATSTGGTQVLHQVSISINSMLIVGTVSGQYASLQTAHDALPAAGGTIFVNATGTPFGVANTTGLSITKPVHIIFDVGIFTYAGTGQAITATSNALTIEGSGNANGQASGPTASGGTQIVITGTAVNGLDVVGGPGMVIKNFSLIGPNSGTGKGIIATANSGHISDVSVRAFGGNGVEVNGTRGNSNLLNLERVTSISNKGWGFNVFGTNGNLIIFINTSGTANTLGNYQIATATNVFLGAHSQTSGTAIGFTFLSGGSTNWGDLYSESGDETTAVAFAAGASNNYFYLSSQTAYTDSGTNNSIRTTRMLQSGGAVGSPAYSFIGSPTTGFYDVGGGAMAFSSVGVAKFLFASASFRQGSLGTYAWSSNADPTAAGNDTGLSRISAAVVGVGGGFQGNTNGTLNAATLIENTLHTPSSAADTGTTGQIAWDASFIYICVATNTWKRVAIATW